MAGEAGQGLAWQGEERPGKAGVDGRGLASQRRGAAGHGRLWQARHGMARRGMFGLVQARQAWLGEAGCGRQVAAWHGAVRAVWRGEAGFLFQGSIRRMVMAKLKIETLRWKSGFPNAGVPVEKAYKECERIRKENDGNLSPEIVLERAADATNVLHPIFEWDDAKAADAHRKRQASGLLRSFEITYKEAPETPRRAYEIHIRKPSGDGERQTLYTTTEEVMANPDSRNRLLSEAIRQLIEFRRRYKGLAELEILLQEIDKVVAETVG